MKWVMSRVLCQNACFSEISHSLARTHVWHAHGEDASGVVQNLRQPGGASSPMHLGCSRPVAQPVPAVWPLLQVNAVHSVCSRKDGEPNMGQMLSCHRRGSERGGVRPAPCEVVLQNESESHWEPTGGSHSREPSGTVRLKAASPESGCGAHSLCPGLLFSTRPSLGSRKPFQSRQVLQRLIQMT